MLVSALAPVATHAPEHIIEEVAVIDIELLTVEIQMKKLHARRDWLMVLRRNFLKRFGD